MFPKGRPKSVVTRNDRNYVLYAQNVGKVLAGGVEKSEEVLLLKSYLLTATTRYS